MLERLWKILSSVLVVVYAATIPAVLLSAALDDERLLKIVLVMWVAGAIGGSFVVFGWVVRTVLREIWQ